MSQEIEIEFKNLISEAEFYQLLARYPFPEQAITQTNYYFETGDFALKERGCALRIREKKDQFVLTLKEPHPNGLLETHDTLTRQEAHAIMNGTYFNKSHVFQRLNAMHISVPSLVYYGKLTTNRRETEFEDVLLVLDHSLYNNTSDYELEIEAPTEQIGLHVFHQILEQQEIIRRDTPNKIERFFSTLSNCRDN
ncbi:CYTH domain-containing protein [Lentibacillus sp. N15]|uniref:CYTH domain-containing protein n=1 Tax=Lentibacillus songyuanensis TaxID=3136161 RepID=UPI0031BB513E